MVTAICGAQRVISLERLFPGTPGPITGGSVEKSKALSQPQLPDTYGFPEPTARIQTGRIEEYVRGMATQIQTLQARQLRQETQMRRTRRDLSVVKKVALWIVARAAALPTDYDGDCIQFKLSYSTFAPFLLFLIEWLDYSCTDSLPSYLGILHILVYKVYIDGMPTMSSQDRKATLREFYAVVYPSLQQLEGFVNVLVQDNNSRTQFPEALGIEAIEGKRDLSGTNNIERDDECGICMECCTKIVLPDCGHSMCNRCFHEW
ncbi:hypothetical protein C3L33_13913, partial [Rhododendron williamsianum]